MIDVARNNCSASIARAIKCGHVALPKAISLSAPARASSSKPSAAPMRKRTSRTPSSRQRSSKRASSTEPSCSPFSSKMMVLQGLSELGRSPPLSGISLCRVGQLIRFRYRSTSSASAERPILPRAMMCRRIAIGADVRAYWAGASGASPNAHMRSRL